MSKRMHSPAIGLLLIILTVVAVPHTVRALTGTHQVIVAYYPIFPRWYTPGNCLFIGDTTLQYPLLGLYNNTTDTNVIRFDFGCMKNMGATVVNPHFFGTTVDTALCNRINQAAGDLGIKWTPTFEAFTDDAPGMANITNAFLSSYGGSPHLMKVNNRPVMFWRLAGGTITENIIANAVEIVRANSGEVMIMLDSQCLGQPCQVCCNGNTNVSQWFKDPDGSTGYQRINGFYCWTPVGWCMFSPSTRRTHINNFVNKCVSNNMIPVLASTPSWNIENWGYGEEGDNCGIPGDLSDMPRYNLTRSLTEWEANLNDLFYNNHANAWMYIQAYDEWGEGSTLAPTTHGCYDFLAKVKTILYNKGWLTDSSAYCRPAYPAGYNPTLCVATPECGGACSGGTDPSGSGSTPGAIATYEAEGGSMGHLTGYQTSTGWRAVIYCTSGTYLAYGPYVSNLPTGNLTARFWLSVDNHTADNSNIARIEVSDYTAGTIIAQQVLTRNIWSQANAYCTFDLAFTNPGGGHQLEFRTFYYGNAQLDLDKVEILQANPPPGKATNPTPANSATGVSTSPTLSWTAGSGATSHKVYFGTSTSPTYKTEQSGTNYNPGTLENGTIYYWRIDEVNTSGTTTGDLWSFTTILGPPTETVATFPFTSDAQSWTLAGWKAGSFKDGTMVWDSASGNPAGNLKANGSGDTNNTDNCTREGASATRVISTVSYTNIQVEYDVIAALNASPGGGCIGTCTDAVLEGSCEDKLVVYYSTAGTGGPWTKVQELNEGDDLPTSWTHKTISLAGVTAVENNANFALQFKWQFNTTTDTGRIDNITVKGSGGPTNTAPQVNAGIDQTITLPSGANLDGTVTDDGLPNPPGAVTVTWSKTSGPGTVTFGNANAVDTTASFSTAGTFVLRLTASDSALSAYDEATITVNPQPAPGKAANPSPANGATRVSTSAMLSWAAGSGATTHKVYFGTTHPPTFKTEQSGTTYNPGALSRLTLYYWRIDEVNAGGTTTGDSWMFTTTLVPGDFDGDGDVDLADFGYLQRCYSGSDTPPEAGCENANLDGDNDVDEADFEVFKNCLGGADQPPGC